MRNVTYRFDDPSQLWVTLRDADQELPLPEGIAVKDGEWVLAMFEVGKRGRATAAAARGLEREDGTVALVFERRDWDRLLVFSETRSEAMPAARAAFGAAPAPSPSRPSAPSAPQPVAPAPGAEGRPRTSVGSIRAAARFSAASGARVLLVDDDPDTRDVVGAMLEAVSLVVETAASGEEALERLASEAFDLCVLDWELPGLSGLDVCKQIRKAPATAALPVIFLSAHSASQEIVDAFASGADDYVTKPFRAPELGARIFSLLRRSRGFAPAP